MIRLGGRQLAAALLLPLMLQGCSSYTGLSATESQPANFPDSFYLQADTNQVYSIDSQLSQIIVTVRRGGLMARLGHDHIVASNNVRGLIYLDSENLLCRAQLYVPLAILEVDNLQLREAAAMTTKPSAADIEGTTSNMLKSIEAEKFPFAQLQSQDCSGALNNQSVPVTLTIHGVTQSRELEISLHQSDDSQLDISGEFSMLQSDFGIQPFSIMNGLIKVQDRLHLSFQLRAQLTQD
ncbi:YceI family protein [Porticoccaceae bacterium]|nr:YceI family protein [Porticoccaceae bacterium]